MSASRVLTPEERRIVADALRAAAAETRRTKTAAVGELYKGFNLKHQNHVDALARLAGIQDRLAAELGEYDLRLERLAS